MADLQNREDINQLVLEASAICNLIEIIANYAVWEKSLNSKEYRVSLEAVNSD